jgi:hypothetical protein
MFCGATQAHANLLANLGKQALMGGLHGAFDHNTAVDMPSFRQYATHGMVSSIGGVLLTHLSRFPPPPMRISTDLDTLPFLLQS